MMCKATRDLQSCTYDEHGCATTANSVKLNEDETETILFSQHLLCPHVTAYHHQSWSLHTKLCFRQELWVSP